MFLSVGVLECFTLTWPASINSVCLNYSQGVYEGNAILQVTQGQRPELPPHTLPFFKGLVESCWAQDPEQVMDALGLYGTKLVSLSA
jgi:hypothetical protein